MKGSRQSTDGLRRALAAALPWLLACGAAAEPGRDGRVFAHVDATPVARIELSLAADESIELEARNARDGAVAELHLWDVQARREVARASGCAFSLCSVRIAYRNPGPAARTYLWIARARDNTSHGRVDLVRDGEVALADTVLAGTQLQVASGRGYVYQAAGVAAGARAATLYALDEEGSLIGLDRDSGPLALPRLAGDARVARVVVAAEAQERGQSALRVYANDPDDRDGDGLGRALEASLRSCDSLEQPACARGALGAFYRKVKHALRDTDRDGLRDGDELFGVGRGHQLDLPRWGADLRHKDVFIEVDYGKDLGPGALDEADLRTLSGIFARGSSRELRNPDGTGGIRLHFDVGFEPVAAANRVLLGTWGGSGRARSRDYKRARESDFAPGRSGYFRYALLTRSGTGQSNGDAFQVNREQHRVAVFAHELGHTLGLTHEGQERAAAINCKPFYLSVMNYTYQNRAALGFMRGGSLRVDPSRALEAMPVSAELGALLRAAPLELDVVDGVGVDWNRDGVIAREPVRAAPTWATYKSCAALGVGRTTFEEVPSAVTPLLVRGGQRLYAFWADDERRLRQRSSALGEASAGSCPHGDRLGTQCTSWSGSLVLPEPAGVLAFAGALVREDRVALAIVREGGAVQLIERPLSQAQAPALTAIELPVLRTAHRPALTRMSVDERIYGAREVWSVLARAQGMPGYLDGSLVQASALDLAGPFQLRAVLDQHGAPISTAYGPSVVELASGELCGVFPNDERFIRFHCYDAARDAWRDLSARAFYAGLGPETGSEVGLAYHRYRGADGGPADPSDDSRGAIYLSFTEPAPGTRGPADNPHLLVSQSLSARQPVADAIDFRWRGNVIDQWTHLAAGTSLTLFEDEDVAALKALMVTRARGGVHLEFLPLADGSFRAELGGGNDFEVMERGICTGLVGKAHCGGAETSPK